MSIDDELLRQNTDTSAAEKAGELRAAQRSQTVQTLAADASFQEQVKAKRGLNITNEARAKELMSRDTPLRQATDGILKFAWENLITSFGLTILLIDAHVFLNKVLGPSAFRDLGEEWIPASIKKLGDKKSKQAATMISLMEKAGCGCINLGCLFLLIAFISLAAIIAKFVTASVLEKIQIMFSWLWSLLGK